MPRPRSNRIRSALNGGTTAPPSRGYNFGLQRARPVQQMGLGQARPAPPAPQGQGQAQPPAAAQPGSASSPWSAQAANSEAGALQRRENTLAGLGSQWQLAQQRYGLEGPWADFKTNPYSEAAKLQRSYDQARQGSTNAYAARGGLYSGALVARQLGNDRNYGEGRSALEMGYAQARAQNIAERQEAENAYIEAINNARWEALMAQIGEAPEAEAAPVGGGPSGGGDQGKRKQKFAVNKTIGGGGKKRR